MSSASRAGACNLDLKVGSRVTVTPTNIDEGGRIRAILPSDEVGSVGDAQTPLQSSPANVLVMGPPRCLVGVVVLRLPQRVRLFIDFFKLSWNSPTLLAVIRQTTNW